MNDATLNPSDVRRASLIVVDQLGHRVNEDLPLLDAGDSMRDAESIIDRLFCMHCCAACAYSFDRRKALEWLERESDSMWLTPAEQAFLSTGAGDERLFRTQIEAMWALTWCLQIVAELQFDRACSDRFVHLLPDLKSEQPTDRFRTQVNLRPRDEVFQALDLAYCLHWSVRESRLTGKPIKHSVPPHVIEERRRALEWVLSTDNWDEISLDT